MDSHKLSSQVMDARSLLARLQDDLESRFPGAPNTAWIVTEIDEVRAILSEVQLDLKEL